MSCFPMAQNVLVLLSNLCKALKSNLKRAETLKFQRTSL